MHKGPKSIKELKRSFLEAEEKLLELETKIKEATKHYLEPNTGSDWLDFEYKLEKLISERNYPKLIGEYRRTEAFIGRFPRLLKEEGARLARMRMMTKIGAQFSAGMEIMEEKERNKNE